MAVFQNRLIGGRTTTRGGSPAPDRTFLRPPAGRKWLVTMYATQHLADGVDAGTPEHMFEIVDVNNRRVAVPVPNFSYDDSNGSAPLKFVLTNDTYLVGTKNLSLAYIYAVEVE